MTPETDLGYEMLKHNMWQLNPQKHHGDSLIQITWLAHMQ